MSASKFKFVSPGIFLKEIDNSRLPTPPTEQGPMVIGLFERGPALQPQRIESLAQLTEIFGEANPGAHSEDTWRSGKLLAPTYAAYAAQAWLRSNSPVTVVRLAGF